MGQNNIFNLKKSKSIMRLESLEPWPSSLSCQRYNQKSIFRLLIRSITHDSSEPRLHIP
jgi:hypothetical protein